MRVAALYDIHGNVPALEAVLRDAQNDGVDEFVIGGDVLPGPMPRDALALLHSLDRPAHFIHGNGESAVLAHLAGREIDVPERFREIIVWNAQQLDAEQQQWLQSWPTTIQLEVPGIGAVLFCHATPRNDTDIFTRETPVDRLLPLFSRVNAQIVVCGHTHMQFDRRAGHLRVVNAGSIGMPFASPGAYWLRLGPDVELRHTAYDLHAAATRIRACDYPQADEFAATAILQPRTEQDMLRLYSGVELPPA